MPKVEIISRASFPMTKACLKWKIIKHFPKANACLKRKYNVVRRLSNISLRLCLPKAEIQHHQMIIEHFSKAYDLPKVEIYSRDHKMEIQL